MPPCCARLRPSPIHTISKLSSVWPITLTGWPSRLSGLRVVLTTAKRDAGIFERGLACTTALSLEMVAQHQRRGAIFFEQKAPRGAYRQFTDGFTARYTHRIRSRYGPDHPPPLRLLALQAQEHHLAPGAVGAISPHQAQGLKLYRSNTRAVEHYLVEFSSHDGHTHGAANRVV